jgi:hypothetical protein
VNCVIIHLAKNCKAVFLLRIKPKISFSSNYYIHYNYNINVTFFNSIYQCIKSKFARKTFVTSKLKSLCNDRIQLSIFVRTKVFPGSSTDGCALIRGTLTFINRWLCFDTRNTNVLLKNQNNSQPEHFYHGLLI